ncbi:hypothetical protein HA402_000990 [Bradysia odoriphaga]|nr:hypothetical protein HA402_000990 [Bradysia odoriphaga]
MPVPEKDGEVILITGGSGFLGQHLVKLLQERDDNCKEIRIVDLVSYTNHLDHSETKPIVSFIGDICEPETIEKAFQGVDCVFHCAAFINFQFPSDLTELERVNVNGTKNIINLCVKYSIPRLIYTSTSAVTILPYMGRATFALVINQTESKAKTPSTDSGFLIPGYSSSKLRAEKIVLAAYGATLGNHVDEMLTVALRPTMMYGEEDYKFMPTIMKVAHNFNQQIPKLFGQGGKHQITYVGNVAWAHIRAKDTLKREPKKIAGLPVFITDDTPIEDTTRFCQRISRATNTLKLRPTWWSVPAFFTYFIAFMLEFFVQLANRLYSGVKLSFQPRALVAYSSSIIMFSRLRASIHLDYEPIFTEDKSIQNSASWYEKWYNDYALAKNSKKNS